MKTSDIINILVIGGMSLTSIPLIQSFSQITPFASLIATIALPFLLLQWKLRIAATPLLKFIIFFVLFVLLHSVVALFIDISYSNNSDIRLFSWFRQIISLFTGFSVYLVLRMTLGIYDTNTAIKKIFLYSSPAIIFSLLHVLWNVSGSGILGIFITHVRSLITAGGGTEPNRVSGFSLEPSHFAVYLVTTLLPVAGIRLIENPEKKLMDFVIFFLLLIPFIFTLSLAGFIIFLVSTFCVMIMYRKWLLSGFCLVTSIVVLIVFGSKLSADSEIYMFRQMAVVQTVSTETGFTNETSASSSSLVDSYFSTVGPFINITKSLSILGYGLGGIATHFDKILPPDAADVLRQYRFEHLPNLSTLVGRVFAESGLIGLVIFALIWLVAMHQSNKIIKAHPKAHFLLQSAKIGLIGTAVSFVIKIGSFSFPYFWFWLSVIDSRSLYYNAMNSKENTGKF